ncbi:MAG TPA: inositol monophosphatase family protein [Candidatus Paceibacterota bacterium]|nr:inositol monophosphatase family protein [Candidatus Paceibacterota bacterium]
MEYADAVLPVMRELRDILLPKWGNATAIRFKSECNYSPVTDVDVAVETYMAKRLRTVFPDFGFVGEESAGDRTAQQFWLMDPIDGTEAYMRGEEGCTSMLALVNNGAVVFSAIYDFVNDVMYWAERNRGAFRDTERLSVSNKQSLANAKIFWEIKVEAGRNRELVNRLNDAGATMVRSTLAGWHYAQVASGAYDARIAVDPFGHDYDFAPGSLLVKEAGGTVINPGMSSYDYTNLEHIAANAVLARILNDEIMNTRRIV